MELEVEVVAVESEGSMGGELGDVLVEVDVVVDVVVEAEAEAEVEFVVVGDLVLGVGTWSSASNMLGMPFLIGYLWPQFLHNNVPSSIWKSKRTSCRARKKASSGVAGISGGILRFTSLPAITKAGQCNLESILRIKPSLKSLLT